MDIFRQLVQALSSVKNPLALIAFLIVSGVASLIYVLKSTNGLASAQQLLLRNSSLKPGEFVRLVNGVLFCLFALAAMLFVFLGYDTYTASKVETQVLKHQIEVLKKSLPCYGDSCSGKEPQELGCNILSKTQTIGVLQSSLDIDGKPTSTNIEVRYSPLCQATWVKTSKVVGASIWFETVTGEKMMEYIIPTSNLQGDAHTDMISADIKGRGCLQAPQQKTLCTSFVEPQSSILK
jgi:hypothetical protein